MTMEVKRRHRHHSSLACVTRSVQFYTKERENTVPFRNWDEGVANKSSDLASIVFKMDATSDVYEAADGDEGYGHGIKYIM